VELAALAAAEAERHGDDWLRFKEADTRREEEGDCRGDEAGA
jgi:hypothetical protein